MADILELYPKKQSEPQCSFCKKKKSHVKKLMSNGIDKYICDVCILKARELING